ncbi:MAG TPA: type II toxin-antitoxin system PemK/MazF family toxin [Thermoanaerobaculia bacterium]|nr:type II toxin-antitoxin system PemK/MazF family toxin [Thermoanaerobaculia bacterium]
MVIRQGDVYWVDPGSSSGSGPAFLHPHVVLQNDIVNQSRLATVIVCTLTTHLKRANAPGNVLLDFDEANLPKRSVVNVSQLFTVDKADLIEKIGTLSPERVQEILNGVYLLLEPRDLPGSHE